MWRRRGDQRGVGSAKGRLRRGRSGAKVQRGEIVVEIKDRVWDRLRRGKLYFKRLKQKVGRNEQIHYYTYYNYS